MPRQKRSYKLKIRRTNHPSVHRMVTLKRAMRLTGRKRIARSKKLRTFWRVRGEVRFDKRRKLAYRSFVMRFRPPRSNATQQVFTGTIRVYGQVGPGPDSAASSRIWARCSCEDWKFMWEYAWHAHGSTEIKYGDGTASTVNNPGLKPGMCKHLIRLAGHVLDMEKKRITRHRAAQKAANTRKARREGGAQSASDLLSQMLGFD